MNAINDALTVAQVRTDLRNGRARAIWEGAGLSQVDVALALGTDPPTVSRWASGQVSPRRDFALKLAGFLWQLDRMTRSAS